MNFDSFYVLQSEHKRGALIVAASTDMLPPAKISQLLRGETILSSPLQFHHHMGSRPTDILDTGHVIPLISDRVFNILQDDGFSGWSTYPVEVFGKGGARLPGYHGLMVTGRCGPIDQSRSRIIVKPPPVPTGRHYQVRLGLYFDPASYDGSDLFLPEGTAFILVTERVKKALENAKCSNAALERITEIERSLL